MIPNWKIYPRSQGHSTVYLKNVVKDPTIQVGEYTTYDDYVTVSYTHLTLPTICSV